MVKKIIGVDEHGKKVFERDARVYDQSIANLRFGVSVGDVLKAVPIIVVCALFYAQDMNFKENQKLFNSQVLASINENSKAIGGIKDVLFNLNSYLSSETGQQFKDGVPR